MGCAGAPSGINGTLTVSDSTDTANILLLGQYTAGQFTSVSDGHSGMLIGDPPAVATDDPNPATLVAPHHA